MTEKMTRRELLKGLAGITMYGHVIKKAYDDIVNPKEQKNDEQETEKNNKNEENESNKKNNNNDQKLNNDN